MSWKASGDDGVLLALAEKQKSNAAISQTIKSDDDLAEWGNVSHLAERPRHRDGEGKYFRIALTFA